MPRFALGVLVSFCCVMSAAAQSSLASAQVNLQFHEPLPANGDTNAARAAVLADAEKACDALTKALNLPCSINNIQFNNGGPFGFMPMGAASANMMNANVNIMLMQPNTNRQ